MKASLRRLQSSLAELAPEQIALVLSVGLVLGVFPMMGVPTLLCLLAAFGLRLNFAALQLINNISSPLQLVLLLPLARAGARFYGTAPVAGGWAGTIGTAAIHAATGWACICVPLGAVMYFSVLFFLRLTMRRVPSEAC
jgi:uncharacterized protein (DUF2062 family)